jgi:hypothetical protein
MPSILQSEDYEEFPVRVLVGTGESQLQLCVRRAYRDFSRTLHGIRIHKGSYEKAARAINRMLADIKGRDEPTQMEFDEWHRNACEDLRRLYREGGYESFFVGQAQKWLNMTFKYIFVLGTRRINGFGHLYDLCHVPLDNIVLEALEAKGMEPLPCPWSRLDAYETYSDRQKWIREHFPYQVPLDVEFRLWLRQSEEPSMSSRAALFQG